MSGPHDTPGFTPQYEPLSQFVAANRALALTMHTKGLRPPRRMAAPAVPTMHPQQSSWTAESTQQTFTILRVGRNGGLEAIRPSRRTDHINRDELAHLCRTSASVPVPVDQRAVERMVAMLRQAPANDTATRELATRVEFSVSVPLSCALAVLTDVLSTTFWCPTRWDPATLGSWLRAFNLPTDGSGIWSLLTHALVDAPLNTAQQSAANHARSAESAITASLTPTVSVSRANAAFEASSSITTARDAYRCADPVFVHEALRTGDVVKALPFAARATTVDAYLSSPSKVKPGEYLVTGMDGQPHGNATLVRVGFDTTTRCVTGQFRSATNKAASKGYAAMTAQAVSRGCASAVLITPKPRLFGSQPVSSPWDAPRHSPDPSRLGSSRQVPLDVALAGART